MKRDHSSPMPQRANRTKTSRSFAADRIEPSIHQPRLLLGSLRRLFRPADLPPLTPIRSLAYFQPVITEQNPLPDGYLDYLRLKLRNVAKDPPADVQKNTFSDDR